MMKNVIKQKKMDCKGERGFTLLELMIALTILAIGMLGIVKMQMQSGFGNVTSRNISAGVNLARSKMEELKRVAAYSVQGGVAVELIDPDPSPGSVSAELADWTNPDFSEGPFNESEESMQPFDQIFTRKWNIVDDYPITNFKTVRIRIEWDEAGRPRNYEVESQIGLKNLVYYE